MRRFAVSPFLLLLLGLTTGIGVLKYADLHRTFEWDVLIPLITAVAIVSYLMTLLLFRYERVERSVIRDHPRQLWMVYPFWLLTSTGLFAGHLAIMLVVPFFALSGVVLGNLIANIICWRRTF